MKDSRFRSRFRIIGELFAPAVPGAVAAGLCAGFAALLAQLIPDYRNHTGWYTIYQLLNLINISFMTYMTAWIGCFACRRFGGTAVLGGMLGMITGLDGINELSKVLGLFRESDPLHSVLSAGSGGILAAIIGAWLLSGLEKWLHSRIPSDLDVVATPFLSLILVLIPYIFVIMPAAGFVSAVICRGLELICLSGNIWIRLLAGYMCAALFLPMVMMGMQYGFTALYSIQLETMGFVTLFPALAMAGAGQVGAGLALLLMARKAHNVRFAGVVRGAVIPGMMGVGNPLLFGVTLPLGKPFLTSCLGGGFGGAFVMAMQVASTSWGPSGLLALPLVTAGPNGAVMGMVLYFTGLCISASMGFIITWVSVKPDILHGV